MLEGVDRGWLALAGVIITGIVTVFVRGLSRRETSEERLARWQSETVIRVNTENKDLRDQVKALQQSVARLFNIEIAYQLVANDLGIRAPESLALAQAEAIMRVTLSAAAPERMMEKIREIDAAVDASEQRRHAAD